MATVSGAVLKGMGGKAYRVQFGGEKLKSLVAAIMSSSEKLLPVLDNPTEPLPISVYVQEDPRISVDCE
jgi:hypothetical protein